MPLLFKYIRLIRPVNIGFLLFSILWVCYWFFPSVQWQDSWLLAFSTSCLAAFGNIHNDICDFESDKINNPGRPLLLEGVSISKANGTAVVFIVLGLVGLLFLGVRELIIIGLISLCALYGYNRFFKGWVLVGNVVIALLLALSIFQTVFLPRDVSNYLGLMPLGLQELILFVFISNLMRELSKDIEDLKGDKAVNTLTLPQLIGIQKTKAVLWLLLGLIGGLLIPLFLGSDKEKLYAGVVTLAILSVSFVLYKVRSDETFYKLSRILKMFMFIGLMFSFLLV